MDQAANQGTAPSQAAQTAQVRKTSDYSITPEMQAEIAALDSGGAEGQSFDESIKALLSDTPAKDESQQEADAGGEFFKELFADKSEAATATTEPGQETLPDGESAKEQIVYKGKVVEVSSDEKTALAQKGFDYEQKMLDIKEQRDEIARERSQFQDELKTHQTKFETDLNQKQQYDGFLEWLAEVSPEKYSEHSVLAKQYQATQKNPYVEAQIKALKDQQNAFNKKIEAQEVAEIRKNFNRELSQVKAKHAAEFAKMLPWNDKMDQELASAWSNSNTDSVFDTYKKLYGDKIWTLMRSKSALNTTQKTAAKKPPTMGSVRPSAAPKAPKIDIKKMDYRHIADALYNELIG